MENLDNELPTDANGWQQFFYERFGDRDWDSYTKNQEYLLKRMIGFAIYGSPIEIGDNDTEIGYGKKANEHINCIYELIWKNHYTSDSNEILLRIIFITCVLQDKKKPLVCRPVFVVKKCSPISTTEDNTFILYDSCNVFIDETARVYQTWGLFLKNNKMPKCTMYCPLNGQYKGQIVGEYNDETEDKELQVMLEIHDSPACSVTHKILKGSDRAKTAVSIGSTATLVAAAIPGVIVAPALIAAAAVGGLAVGAYTVGRSVANLRDRKKHDQSIALSDPEARSQWIDAGVGVLGASSSAAGMVVTAASQGANISQAAATAAYNALNVASMVGTSTSFLFSGYNIYEKLCNNEIPTSLDIFQFSSSVLFFHKSVVGFKTARTIISETSSTTLKEYGETLRKKRHKKLFVKAKLEALSTDITQPGYQELISGIQDIDDPNNFFYGLAKINKDLNRTGERYFITSNDFVKINKAYIIDGSELENIGSRKKCIEIAEDAQDLVDTQSCSTDLEEMDDNIDDISDLNLIKISTQMDYQSDTQLGLQNSTQSGELDSSNVLEDKTLSEVKNLYPQKSPQLASQNKTNLDSNKLTESQSGSGLANNLLQYHQSCVDEASDKNINEEFNLNVRNTDTIGIQVDNSGEHSPELNNYVHPLNTQLGSNTSLECNLSSSKSNISVTSGSGTFSKKDFLGSRSLSTQSEPYDTELDATKSISVDCNLNDDYLGTENPSTQLSEHNDFSKSVSIDCNLNKKLMNPSTQKLDTNKSISIDNLSKKKAQHPITQKLNTPKSISVDSNLSKNKLKSTRLGNLDTKKLGTPKSISVDSNLSKNKLTTQSGSQNLGAKDSGSQNSVIEEESITDSVFAKKYTFIIRTVYKILEKTKVGQITKEYFQNLKDLETITLLLKKLSDEDVQLIIKILIILVDNFHEKLITFFGKLYPFVSILTGALQFLLKYIENDASDLELNFQDLLMTFLNHDENVNELFVKQICNKFEEWVLDKIEELRNSKMKSKEPRRPKIRKICTDCQGYYFVFIE